MADADRATCPRCGAPIPADEPPGLCPRCLLSDTQRDKTEIPPVSPSSTERARRKMTLASIVAAIGTIIFGGFWLGHRRRQQSADAAAHYNRGADLGAQWKMEEAVAEFRTAIRLKPDFAEAHYNLGVALTAQRKLEEAIAELRTAIRLKPDFAEAHYNLGNFLVERRKLEEAAAEFRTAIRIKPDFALAHMNLGNALVGQGKLEEAVAEYRTAIRIKPDDADAHYNLGTVLKAQGKLDEAVGEFRKASDSAQRLRARPGNRARTDRDRPSG